MKTDDMLAPGAPAAAPATAAGFALLPDTGGTITELAICIIKETLKDAKRHQAYGNLLQVLGGSAAALTVVTEQSLVARVDPWLRGLLPNNNFTILPIPDGPFEKSDVWPRDSMLCAAGPGAAQQFLHPHVRIGGDLATWLATKFGVSLTELDVWLDGGDSLVVDDTHWIVGAGAISWALEKKAAPDWDSAVRKLETTVGRKPVIAGYRQQDVSLFVQWRHVRMRTRRRAKKRYPARPVAAHFASLFAATAQILQNIMHPDQLETDWDHIDMVVSVTGTFEDGTGKPVILVADPLGKGCPPGSSDGERQVVKEKADILSSLAAVLQDGGFKVIRNPAPCIDQFVLGCNNTIVQRPGTVWLPVFASDMPSLAAADAENIRIWRQDLHFTNVVPVPGWMDYNNAQGCIRCATLPLRRNPTPP